MMSVVATEWTATCDECQLEEISPVGISRAQFIDWLRDWGWVLLDGTCYCPDPNCQKIAESLE